MNEDLFTIRANLLLNFTFGQSLGSKLIVSDDGDITSVNTNHFPLRHFLKTDDNIDYKNELYFSGCNDIVDDKYSLFYHIPFTFNENYNKSFNTIFDCYDTEHNNYLLLRAAIHLMFGNYVIVDTSKIYREYNNSFISYYFCSISIMNNKNEYDDFYIGYHGNLDLWKDNMFLESLQQISYETAQIEIPINGMNFDSFYHVAKNIRMMRY